MWLLSDMKEPKASAGLSCSLASCLLVCFYVDVVDSEAFMPPVKTPTEVVGLKAASLPAPQTSTALQNISLKHPWTEIQ